MQRPYDAAQVASFRSLHRNFFTHNDVHRALDTDHDPDRMTPRRLCQFRQRSDRRVSRSTRQIRFRMSTRRSTALRMDQKCYNIRACGQDLRPGWTRDISTARNCYLIANDCCLDTGTTRDEVAKRLRHDRNNETTRHSG